MERRTLDSCGKERENGDPAAQWNERVETNQRDGNSYSVRLLEAIILLCPKLFSYSIGMLVNDIGI
ncbi:hypothetical protein A2U94_03635 [Bacillus sp. VT 712]|nr:hypothetical protein A2U94_03635 [Bacillus sp. VT 712]